MQLHFLRVELRGEAADVGRFGQVVGQGFGHALREAHALEHQREFLQRGVKTQGARGHRIGHGKQGLAVFGEQGFANLHQVGGVDGAQHAAHRFFGHGAGGIGNGLVGQRERIAHRAVCGLREQAQRIGFVLHAFVVQHTAQVVDDVPGRHLLEVELQAARQHRDGHFLRVGRREDELEVRRRLFERLQHRVEGVVREHVHFVDHVDLEARGRGRVGRAFEQRGHFINAAVRGRVHLDVIDKPAGIDRGAGLAHAARRGGDAALPVRAHAIERFGEDARERGLADAAGAGEQISVVQPLLGERVRERTHDVLLPDELREVARPVFAGKDEIAHAMENGVLKMEEVSLVLGTRA